MNSLRRGVDRARTRGEEVAQTTRLRFEIFGLNRELDALYGRLGRAYHASADLAVLQPIRDEIGRVDEEITARERLIVELSAPASPPEPRVKASDADPNPVPTEPVPLSKDQP